MQIDAVKVLATVPWLRLHRSFLFCGLMVCAAQTRLRVQRYKVEQC